MILRVLILSLCLCTPALATSDLFVSWAYPEEAECDGFRLYIKSGTEWAAVQDITDGNIREWRGKVNLQPGENNFVLTAYDSDSESNYSGEYTLSYVLEFNVPVLQGVTVD